MEQCESLNEKLFPPSAEGPTNCPFPKKSEEPKKGDPNREFLEKRKEKAAPLRSFGAARRPFCLSRFELL